MAYTTQSAYTIKDGDAISVTTAAAQATGFSVGSYVAISNTGSAVAYINTNNETATTASLPIFVSETKSPILLPNGTINHIGAGSTTLVVNVLESVGSAW